MRVLKVEKAVHIDGLKGMRKECDSCHFHGQKEKQAEWQAATALPDGYERQEAGSAAGIDSSGKPLGATAHGEYAQRGQCRAVRCPRGLFVAVAAAHAFPAVGNRVWLLSALEQDGVWQRMHDTLRAWVRQKAGHHKLGFKP